MSKFYILSRNERAGIIGSDSGHQSEYTELGWELAIFRIYFNELVKDGTFDQEQDFVVTNDDRAFLYTKYCKNVISFKDFMGMNIDQEYVVDITSYNLDRHLVDKIFTEETRLYNDSVHQNQLNTELDLPDISEILKNNNEFVCITVRRRDYVSARSIDENNIRTVIDYYRALGKTVYVMGKSCEDYENGTDVFHVSLPELAALLNHPKCELFITPTSGGGMIRFYTGKCKMVVVDHTHCVHDHVLFFGADVDRTGTINNETLSIVRSILDVVV